MTRDHRARRDARRRAAATGEPYSTARRAVTAVRCHRCANLTRDPSGLCHLHRNLRSSGPVTELPAVPAPTASAPPAAPPHPRDVGEVLLLDSGRRLWGVEEEMPGVTVGEAEEDAAELALRHGLGIEVVRTREGGAHPADVAFSGSWAGIAALRAEILGRPELASVPEPPLTEDGPILGVSGERFPCDFGEVTLRDPDRDLWSVEEELPGSRWSLIGDRGWSSEQRRRSAEELASRHGLEIERMESPPGAVFAGPWRGIAALEAELQQRPEFASTRRPEMNPW